MCWQGLAEDAQSLRKGSAIRVEGFEKHRTFEGKDGVEREIVEIVADKFHALDTVEQPASAPMTQGERSKSVPKLSPRPAGNANGPANGGVPRAQIPDDEIPF